MQTTKRFIAALLSLSLILGSLPPLPAPAAQAAIGETLQLPASDLKQSESTTTKKSTDSDKQKVNSASALPPFPEDTKRPTVDWSKVDWDRRVTSLSDNLTYHRELQSLIAAGKTEEADALQPSEKPLSDESVMAAYNVPPAIRELVRSYTADQARAEQETGFFARLFGLGATSTQAVAERKALLSAEIKATLRAAGLLVPLHRSVKQKNNSHAKNSSAIPMLNLDKAQKFQIKKFSGQNPQPDAPSPKVLALSEAVPISLQDSQRAAATLKKANTQKQFSLLADTEPTPIISYYDGIENHPIENTLYYLARNQNADGSFGTFNQYDLTSQIAVILSYYTKNDSGQFAAMVDYLKRYIPKNNREKAIKARLLFGLGENYQPLLDELAAQQNPEDGSFPFAPNYQGDPETTLEVIWAFWEAGQVNAAVTGGLTYISHQIRADGSIGYFASGEPSYYLINKTLEYLQPFEGFSFGSTLENVVSLRSQIDQMLHFLISHYDSENKTLAGSSAIIDTLMTLRSFRLYAYAPEQQALLFESAKEQQNFNGSFGTSLYATIAALRALAQPDIAIVSFENAGSLQNKEKNIFTINIKNFGYAPVSSFQLDLFLDNFYRQKFNAHYVNFVINPQELGKIKLDISSYTALLDDTRLSIYLDVNNDFTSENNWITKNFFFTPPADKAPVPPIYFSAFSHYDAALKQPMIVLDWSEKPDVHRDNYVIFFKKAIDPPSAYFGVKIGSSGHSYALYGSQLQDGTLYDIGVGVATDADPGQIYLVDEFEPIQIYYTSHPELYQGSISGTLAGTKKFLSDLPVTIKGKGTELESTILTAIDGSFALDAVNSGTRLISLGNNAYEPFFTKAKVTKEIPAKDIQVFMRLKEDKIPPTITSMTTSVAPLNYLLQNQTTTITVAASDNLALREADFYYYDPGEAMWLYLGSSNFDGNNTSLLKWYIPAALTGTGYRIKAIAWDHQDNQSAPVEWGPFEIRDRDPRFPYFDTSYQEPTDLATNISKTPVLRWQAHDDQNDPLDYYVALGEDPENLFRHRSFGRTGHIGQNYFDFATESSSVMKPDTTYYWQIWAREGTNDQTYYGGSYPRSPVWHFTTEATGPDLALVGATPQKEITPNSWNYFDIIVRNQGNQNSNTGCFTADYIKNGVSSPFRSVSGCLTQSLAPGQETVIQVGVQFGSSLITENDQVYDNILITAGSLIRFQLDHYNDQDLDPENNILTYAVNINDTTPPTIQSFDIRFASTNPIKNQTTRDLIVQATDNFGLDLVSFYYYDPHTQTWSLLGTESFAGSTTVILKWPIPSSFVGTDYKVKAVVADFLGNTTEAEYGPFEILEGTMPTGAITLPDLDQNTWSLGETKTITWNIQTANSLKSISGIRLYYGTNSSLIADTYDIAKNTMNYAIPLTSAYISSQAYFQLTACDKNNNCSQILSPAFSIVDNTSPPQAPWGVPQSSGFVFSGPKLDRSLIDIYKNSDGSTEVLYLEWDGWYWEAAGQYRRIVYRKFANGVWQNPLILKQYWYYSSQNSSVDFIEFQSFKSANGDIHLVYSRVPSLGTWQANYDGQEIFYSHLASGGIVADRQLSNNTTNSSNPKLTVNSQGRVSVVWRDGYSYVSDSGTRSLYYIEGDGGNAWTSSISITGSNPSWSAAISLDGGQPVVLAILNGQFQLLRRQNGTWLTPTIVNNPKIPKSSLDIFTADKDKLSRIVTQDPADSRMYLWLSNIRVRTELENVLTAENFTEKNGILNAWYQNEFANTTDKLTLFSRGSGAYDIFYLRQTPQTSGYYDLSRLKLQLNQSTGLGAVSEQILADRLPKENIRNYKVLRNSAGDYHLFYVKSDLSGMSHAYHLFFDGSQTHFATWTSSIAMGVGDEITGTENSNRLTTYFTGDTAGVKTLFSNAADYSRTIDYRLVPASTQFIQDVTGPKAVLGWSSISGAVDRYDILLGLSPIDLDPVAIGTQSTNFTTTGLLPQTSYYWRVLANNGYQVIPSSIWSFQTPVKNLPPQLTLLRPNDSSNLADQSYEITWQATDTEDNAMINLYYDADDTGADGVRINLAPIFEDNLGNSLVWNTADLTAGDYYIYATIDDGFNPPLTIYSANKITIQHSSCHPPLTGDWTITESCTITAETTFTGNLTIRNQSKPVLAGTLTITDGNIRIEDNSVLTLTPTAKLYLDLHNHNLRILPGSGLLIQPGGKLEGRE